LALSFALIYYLEDRLNSWFSQFTGAESHASPGASGAPGTTASEKAGLIKPHRPIRLRYKVVIDPGHGGRAERRSATTGDSWDPASGEFLAPYMGGGS